VPSLKSPGVWLPSSNFCKIGVLQFGGLCSLRLHVMSIRREKNWRAAGLQCRFHRSWSTFDEGSMSNRLSATQCSVKNTSLLHSLEHCDSCEQMSRAHLAVVELQLMLQLLDLNRCSSLICSRFVLSCGNSQLCCRLPPRSLPRYSSVVSAQILCIQHSYSCIADSCKTQQVRNTNNQAHISCAVCEAERSLECMGAGTSPFGIASQNMRTFAFVVAAVALLACCTGVQADTAANCTYDDALGTWQVRLCN
jgi:hypothetical protein